jgi:uncharacterized protein
MPAAEQFLLARYTLHEQVYFHKTTRCVEYMIAALLRAIARLATEGKKGALRTGLPPEHPLLRFFRPGGDTTENYLALDDAMVSGSFDALAKATDPNIASMARRIRNRDLFKTLDIAEFGGNDGRQRFKLRVIKNRFAEKINEGIVMIDDKASIGIYSEIGGDDEKMYKKLHILDGEQPVEISTLSKLVKALTDKRQFTRLYFAERADRDAARNSGGTL